MASSYSADLKLELMATGEKSGLWGDITNTNLIILQQAIAGYEEVSIAGGAQTTALVFSNGLVSNGKNAVIKFTGTITGNQVVTIPDTIEKTYTIINGTSGAFTVEFKTVSGTGFTFAAADKGTRLAYADGTNVVDVNAAFTTISQFTLPTADGTADQALITDASGNLSFSGPFATNGKAIAFAIVF
jgi:trimeric autotransporter adhesin